MSTRYTDTNETLLAERLKRQAAELEPAFSELLHARIMHAVRHAAPQPAPPQPQPQPVAFAGRWYWSVALAAAVLLTVTASLWMANHEAARPRSIATSSIISDVPDLPQLAMSKTGAFLAATIGPDPFADLSDPPAAAHRLIDYLPFNVNGNVNGDTQTQ